MTILKYNWSLASERKNASWRKNGEKWSYLCIFEDSTLLLGSRRITAGVLSSSFGRKKEIHKISVILRLIKTAIFHDSPEFWLSSVGRAYYRGEHSWTPTGETHTSWGDVWRSKEWDASLILSRDHRRVMRGFHLWSSNQGWTPRERVAETGIIFDVAQCRWYREWLTRSKDS